MPWAIALVFLTIWNVMLFVPGDTPALRGDPVLGLRRQVKEDNVASVRFTGQTLDGSFVQPTIWPPVDSPAAIIAAGRC